MRLPFSTPIIDTFDRADAATLGASWTGQSDNPSQDIGVISNQAGTALTGLTTEFYTASGFYMADQEWYVTVPTLPGGGELIEIEARASAIVSPFTKLKLRVIDSTSTWEIRKHLASSSSTLIASFTQAIAAGDSFGFRAIGIRLEAWRKASGGAWVLVGSATDSEVLGPGYGGIATSSNVTRLNDFGGGGVPQYLYWTRAKARRGRRFATLAK